MRAPSLVFGLLAALVCSPVIAEAPPRFPPGAVWQQDISRTRLHRNSPSMISTLVGLGGFGNGRLQIDFSMHIVRAPAGAPLRGIVGYPTDSEYYAPDCEATGTLMPVPANAAIEGENGLTCDNDNGDCHLLVVQDQHLYEAYRANASGPNGLQAQCLAVWKLDWIYPEDNRGDHCTSADAAGFPIAPLLFNADEVHAAMQGVATWAMRSGSSCPMRAWRRASSMALAVRCMSGLPVMRVDRRARTPLCRTVRGCGCARIFL